MKLPDNIATILQEGTIIPAHPLALTADLKIDEPAQRRLTRYYLESGAGGIAIGVHTTQFEIRQNNFRLYEPVIAMAAGEIEDHARANSFIKVAGICGPTEQATAEAKAAVKYGYHLGLLSMGGLNHLSEGELLERTRAVGEIIPVFGFYLQPAVGGRILSYRFWEEFANIPSVKAIKIAAFNRYQTLDVVRAVSNSSRQDEIALYTGNDDNIVADLLTPYEFTVSGKKIRKQFVGGLLGHWAVWTNSVVNLFKEIKAARSGDSHKIPDLLKAGVAITDMNAALFDPVNSFRGSISGIHEVLRRQGLMNGIWCISPQERLSEGQLEEIDRVMRLYPEFQDDAFVAEFLSSDFE